MERRPDEADQRAPSHWRPPTTGDECQDGLSCNSAACNKDRSDTPQQRGRRVGRGVKRRAWARARISFRSRYMNEGIAQFSSQVHCTWLVLISWACPARRLCEVVAGGRPTVALTGTIRAGGSRFRYSPVRSHSSPWTRRARSTSSSPATTRPGGEAGP